MGFIARMMKSKPRVVERDGGKFLFTPGDNGSTRQLAPILPKGPAPIVNKPTAKAISAPMSSMPVVPRPAAAPAFKSKVLGRFPDPAAPAGPASPAARRLLALKSINGKRLFSF